jgi:hypothetical protein
MASRTKEAVLYRHREEYVGKVFDRLTIKDFFFDERNILKVKCKCVCGRDKVTWFYSLKHRRSGSCGCSRLKTTEDYNKYIGQVFGDLTIVSVDKFVLKSTSKFGRYIFVLCDCSCGNQISVNLGNLLHAHTKSCGCKKYFKLPIGEAAIRAKYKEYSTSAKAKLLGFEITMEKFLELSQDKCAYCNRQPFTIRKNVSGNFVYNGIDRVDSSKGYTLDNVVPCCKNCNRAKMDQSLEDFKSMIKRIYDHMKLGEQ